MAASNHHYSPINTLELKNQIFQKIGHQRADRYFDLLERFFSFRIDKIEFNKLCLNTIGREHIKLHNLIIHSILKNASLSKVPPRNVRVRKGRTPIGRNNRKFRDRPSPLGPLAKTPTSTATISRPVLEEDNGDGDGEGEEVEQITVTHLPITAPLGISMKPLPQTTPQLKICENRRELPDTKSLFVDLDKLVAAKGLRLSVDTAKLLNEGLNVYLKRLIEPCIGLARARSSRINDDGQTVRQPVCASMEDLCTTVAVDNNPQSLGQSVRQPVCASMEDLRTAVENNPQSLGQDWSSMMEKVCFRAMPEVDEWGGKK